MVLCSIPLSIFYYILFQKQKYDNLKMINKTRHFKQKFWESLCNEVFVLENSVIWNGCGLLRLTLHGDFSSKLNILPEVYITHHIKFCAVFHDEWVRESLVHFIYTCVDRGVQTDDWRDTHFVVMMDFEGFTVQIAERRTKWEQISQVFDRTETIAFNVNTWKREKWYWI